MIESERNELKAVIRAAVQRRAEVERRREDAEAMRASAWAEENFEPRVRGLLHFQPTWSQEYDSRCVYFDVEDDNGEVATFKLIPTEGAFAELIMQQPGDKEERATLDDSDHLFAILREWLELD